MVLKGIIDAAIGGGPRVYQEAFLSGEYSIEEENKKNKMKSLLRRMKRLLGNALRLHKRIIPENMNSLQEQFEKMYIDIIQSDMI